MTKAQHAALWTVALTNLATAIRDGIVDAPTSMHLWTQYVTPGEMLRIADFSYSKPLPIKIHPNFASLTVPTGELLELPIDWTVQVDLASPDVDREYAVLGFETHNAECVGAGAPDADTHDSVHPSILDDRTRTGAAKSAD